MYSGGKRSAKPCTYSTDNQLRAGADASRADAEWARAKVNLARARQQEQVSRAILADILGHAGYSVDVRDDSLQGPPSDTTPQKTVLAAHPGAEMQHARVAEAQAQVHALDRAYYPKIYLQSSVYGRGSGVDPTGIFSEARTVWVRIAGNWAAGVSVTFPIFDIFAIRSKRAIEAANERAEAARYDQTLQDLTGELRKAKIADCR